MCGIAGFNWIDRKIIKKMTDSLVHRGPDAGGFVIDKFVSLGSRRLSIVDLSVKGKQPMEFRNLIIVFNGEIYNYRELKDELKKYGHKFSSQTDTEVILHSYYQWGQDCVKKFNGMWAFCIYDKKSKVFFISRDRFGIKPLYYYYDGGKFIFASELKAIKHHKVKLNLNKKAVNYFFYQKYIGGSLSIYTKIYKLKPGHNLFFDLISKKIKLRKYYFLEKEIKNASKISLALRLVKIKYLLIDSVEKRLVADVPVGSFLSGGVDSSIISAIIAKKIKNFKTFSIGFKEESFNELSYSKIVSSYLRTKHYYRYLIINNKLIEYIIKNLDEPFGDSSLLPTYLLSKIAKEKVTVSLSGDGGDEIFGGYENYKAYKIAKYIPGFIISILSLAIKFIPPSEKKLSLSFKIKKFVSDKNKNINRRHLNWIATFNEIERKRLLKKNYIDDSKIIKTEFGRNLLSLQLNDIHNYLSEDILKKLDIASMQNSLEARVPYLDYRLVPLVLSLPEKFKISGFQTKHLLRKIGKEYLPKKIINRKKSGFSCPISRWLKTNRIIKKYLLSSKFYKHGCLDKNYVALLFNEHINNISDHSRKLWLVFVFNYWIDKQKLDISNNYAERKYQK